MQATNATARQSEPFALRVGKMASAIRLEGDWTAEVVRARMWDAATMNYEVDFLPVGDGSGDAIVIRYGDDTEGYYLHVIDGGRTETAETIINHINKFYPGYHINHMVLSHADDDHATGLVGVMEQIDVKNLWMNRPWLYAAEILHHFHGNFTLQGLIDNIKEQHPYLVELERGLPFKRGPTFTRSFRARRLAHSPSLRPQETGMSTRSLISGKPPTGT